MEVSQPSNKQKMITGELYYASDPQLCAERAICRQRLQTLNASCPCDVDMLPAYQALFGSIATDYGYNIHLGSDVYMNFNVVILDCAPVHIGSRVLFAPNVQLYTASHPLDAHVRNGTTGPEWAKPIVIEDDVWLGGGAIILPGVTVGKGSSVGAGSVVTKDVEPYTVVAGNPARFLRTLERPA